MTPAARAARARYARLKAAHLCIKCGCNPPYKHYVKCQGCHGDMLSEHRTRRERERARLRASGAYRRPGRPLGAKTSLWDRLASPDDAWDGTIALPNARCRCGLLLPCNNCLPERADAYAFRRSEHTYPEPASGGAELRALLPNLDGPNRARQYPRRKRP